MLAHPGLLSNSVQEMIEPNLANMGFWGVEAYHPAHTDGQCIIFENMARCQKLFVTSGSDFHGSLTPVHIGGETRRSEWLLESSKMLYNYEFNN